MKKIFNIKSPCLDIKQDIQDKIDNLNKPKGSLGTLEDLALQICLIQQTLSPELSHPCHILFGGDHGIEREGVSVSPRNVTWQQMINFTKGGGGVNMFCNQHGFELKIVDIGVDYNLTDNPKIINRKIANGTKNFLYEPAMTEEQFRNAIDIGVAMTDECISEGCNVICIGEMGIANTSPSSIWMSIFGGIPLKESIGAGAGLSDEGIKHKYDILKKSIEKFNTSNHDIIDTIRYFGGFEMVGAMGSMLRAAEKHVLILVDGFIMSACIMAASKLYPEILKYAIFGHCGDESGHRKMLNILNVKPLLSLGLRLGEGTGALCAYPIIQSAVNMMNEMNNFNNAHITKYF